MFTPTSGQLAHLDTLITKPTALLDYIQEILPKTEEIDPSFSVNLQTLLLNVARGARSSDPALFERSYLLIFDICKQSPQAFQTKTALYELLADQVPSNDALYRPSTYKLNVIQTFLSTAEYHTALPEVIDDVLVSDTREFDPVFSLYLQFVLLNLSRNEHLKLGALLQMYRVRTRNMQTRDQAISDFMQLFSPDNDNLSIKTKENLLHTLLNSLIEADHDVFFMIMDFFFPAEDAPDDFNEAMVRLLIGAIPNHLDQLQECVSGLEESSLKLNSTLNIFIQAVVLAMSHQTTLNTLDESDDPDDENKSDEYLTRVEALADFVAKQISKEHLRFYLILCKKILRDERLSNTFAIAFINAIEETFPKAIAMAFKDEPLLLAEYLILFKEESTGFTWSPAGWLLLTTHPSPEVIAKIKEEMQLLSPLDAKKLSTDLLQKEQCAAFWPMATEFIDEKDENHTADEDASDDSASDLEEDNSALLTFSEAQLNFIEALKDDPESLLETLAQLPAENFSPIDEPCCNRLLTLIEEVKFPSTISLTASKNLQYLLFNIAQHPSLFARAVTQITRIYNRPVDEENPLLTRFKNLFSEKNTTLTVEVKIVTLTNLLAAQKPAVTLGLHIVEEIFSFPNSPAYSDAIFFALIPAVAQHAELIFDEINSIRDDLIKQYTDGVSPTLYHLIMTLAATICQKLMTENKNVEAAATSINKIATLASLLTALIKAPQADGFIDCFKSGCLLFHKNDLRHLFSRDCLRNLYQKFPEQLKTKFSDNPLLLSEVLSKKRNYEDTIGSCGQASSSDQVCPAWLNQIKPAPMFHAATYQQQKLHFKEITIAGDGECAFSALETSREEVIGLLISLSEDEAVRLRFAVEMREHWFMKHTHNKADYSNHGVIKNLDAYMEKCNESDMVQREIVSRHTELENHTLEERIFLLPDGSEDRIALMKIDVSLKELDAALNAYFASKAGYEEYMHALSGGTWGSIQALLEYARLSNINLCIWKPAKEGLIIEANHNDPLAADTKHLIFKYNHFDQLQRLEIKEEEKPKLSLQT